MYIVSFSAFCANVLVDEFTIEHRLVETKMCANDNSCTYVGHIDDNDSPSTNHMVGTVVVSPVMGGTRVTAVAVLTQVLNVQVSDQALSQDSNAGPVLYSTVRSPGPHPRIQEGISIGGQGW